MPHEDEMQVAVFSARPDVTVTDNGSIPVEMGGGEGNLVRIWACHWAIELLRLTDSNAIDLFLGLALSSNPEHELTPLEDFVDYQENKALYARARWTYNSLTRIVFQTNGIDWGYAYASDLQTQAQTQIIPCYGVVRPRRQIMVWSLLAFTASIGLTLEVYYTAFGARRTEREEVNRKYGKYRRS